MFNPCPCNFFGIDLSKIANELRFGVSVYGIRGDSFFRVDEQVQKDRFRFCFVAISVQKWAVLRKIDNTPKELEPNQRKNSLFLTPNLIRNIVKQTWQKQRRIQTGAWGGGGHLVKTKGLTLIFFCAPATWHAAGGCTKAAVGQRPNQCTARRQLYVFRRLYYPCLAWDWPRRAKFLLGLFVEV